MEHTLNTICDFSRPENTAIEYHNSKEIKRINYSVLKDTEKSIESILFFIKKFEFIGINYDIKTYCVPALILGIQASGCGFMNLPSQNGIKICSKLEIRFIFSDSMIPGADLICEMNIHGETVKLLKYNSTLLSLNNTNFAFAITTSGSTGEPKIVKVPNSCIVPNILDLKEILRLSESDKIAQITNLTFDPSIIEIFLSLSCGGTLFTFSQDMKNDPNELLRIIFDHKITVLQTTPSLWQYRWSDNEIKNTIFSKKSHLKSLLIGGESFPKIDNLISLKDDENNTKIYNIYGITEVSCWASINEINLTNSYQINDENYQNLGTTLSQTIFQVRNHNGDVIRDNGEGVLYIGSDSRICVIDNEESVIISSKTPVFRKTGDLVMIDGGNVYYKNRCDKIVKRFGNRLDLTELESVVLKLNFVKNCLSLWDDKRRKLYLCVSLLTINQGKEIEDKFKNDSRIEEEELKKEIKKLPPFYQPDRIKYFNNFELNSSGKICRNTLMKLFENGENRLYSKNARNISNIKTAEEIFIKICKNHLITVIPDSRFIENGGTSVIAMQISNELSTALDSEFPELIGLLLRNETLMNCIDYVYKKIRYSYSEDNDIDDSSSNSNSGSSEMNKKRMKYDFQYPEKILKLIKDESSCEWQKCRGITTGVISRNDYSLHKGYDIELLKLNLEYKKDLKKCVDASPTVFKYFSGEIYATVGSHAGIILTKQLNNDNKTYEINLPDRIEASVLVLNDFNAIVGCYDGYIYSLNLKTGQILWKFKTGDVVKCTAVLSGDEKSIFVGSYDKYFYKICVKDGSEMWKLRESDASISATPRTCSKLNSIVFGTLDGTCVSSNQTSGEIIWKNKFQNPIFSAPGILENGNTVFCSVSGEVKCFHSETGRQIWRYKIDGNVFSHLVINKNVNLENTEDLIIGCSDKNVYCFVLKSDLSAPILRYSVSFECQIFATPYCEGGILAVADTSGNINLLNSYNGVIFNSFKLDGDVYSSPVIAENFIVVGCRDNNMYVFTIR